MKLIDWLTSHKALIGAVVVAIGGYLTGALDLTATIAAVLAALSGGLRPTPAPETIPFRSSPTPTPPPADEFDRRRRDAA